MFSRRQFFGGWASLLAAAPFLSQALAGSAVAATKTPGESLSALLVYANHILVDQDVLDGYGQVSARDSRNPNHYLLARAMPPAMVEEEDLMIFDLDSKGTGKDNRLPHLDRFMHGEIYRARPDVNVVVYCQTPELVPFGVTDAPLRPLTHMTSFISSGVPVFDIRKFRSPSDKSMLVHDASLGRSLAEVLAHHSAVLMRGYGAVIVGSSVPQAVGRSVYLKIDASTLASAVSFDRPINYVEDGEGLEAALSNFDRMWDMWVDEQDDKEANKDASNRS